MTGRRVVVTGMGLVSPVGLDVEASWRRLIAGESGIGPIGRFDAACHDTRIAGEVKGFDAAAVVGAKAARRTDRFVQLAMAAAREAVTQAGLEVDATNADRVGVIIGSGIGGIESLEHGARTILERGPSRVSPFLVPMLIADMASGEVSIWLGAKATNWAPVSACATSAHAIGESAEIIRRGEADVMVTGGAEAPVTPLSVAAFGNMKALSRRNDEPRRASRPFDKERDGFVIAEGAAIVVLEAAEHAEARGARAFGEVAGYGSTADASHITQPAPAGEGAARAMRLALRQAGLEPSAIDYINAHGTSTPLNDAFETQAIKSVFGDHAARVAISSTKSMTGHLLGAAGALEAIVCLKAIAEAVVPPTINLDNPDPECDLDYVPHTARQMTVRAALSNSLGFGGHNACLVLRAVA